MARYQIDNSVLQLLDLFFKGLGSGLLGGELILELSSSTPNSTSSSFIRLSLSLAVSTSIIY